MTKRIICSVDGSDAALDVVSVARSLAQALACHLVLFHAASRPPPASRGMMPYAYPYLDERDREALREDGERLLERVAHEFPLPAATERRVELGVASTILPGVAEELAADLIVVGTRGRGRLAAAILGSVSSAAISHGPCPVVVVPAGAGLAYGPVVCAVDETSAGRRATRLAWQFAEQLEADLVLAHATAESLGAPAFEDFRSDVDRRVLHGTSAEAICRLADEENAALVVVGMRRRGAIRAALGGSVSRELIAISSRPVVVVGPL